MKKALFYGICPAILCLCHACQDPSRLEICNLRCEMLEAPLAIDNTSPHFSWEMRSKDNAMGISAYQILVATEPGRLNEKEADLWNSGKVEKDASLGIVYEGKKLAPRSLAYWKVRVWNQEGVASDWSANSLFGIGILEEKDGQWYISKLQFINNLNTAYVIGAWIAALVMTASLLLLGLLWVIAI